MPEVQSLFTEESSLLGNDLSFYSTCRCNAWKIFSLLYNTEIKVYARGAKLFVKESSLLDIDL